MENEDLFMAQALHNFKDVNKSRTNNQLVTYIYTLNVDQRLIYDNITDSGSILMQWYSQPKKWNVKLIEEYTYKIRLGIQCIPSAILTPISNPIYRTVISHSKIALNL